ncbi:MAG: phytanoyl-CoA dioxygenase family protein [Candidatus Latescibacteria bacterium]|jgi:phytanoyl-CoA hydroxylase|nr:phytanoyl-CoA dioxygenase family protein [Candidatus Latescibacterota bacterium]
MGCTGSIPEDIVDQFDEMGYVVLRGFFDGSVVDRAIEAMTPLVDACAAELVAEGVHQDMLSRESFERRLSRLYEPCMEKAPSIFRRELHLAGLYDVFFHSRLLDAVEMILGSEIRLYPNYSVRPKLPDHAKTLVLWHQDGGYTQNAHLAGIHEERAVEVLRMVNIWCPLVPATEFNGCMQFIPRTHKLGLVPHEGREFYLEISAAALEPFLDQAASIELDPGDVVLFHNMLFHQGLPNRSDAVRWSMDWRYQDATQSTLRKEEGHMARSSRDDADVVKNAADWVSRSFQ